MKRRYIFLAGVLFLRLALDLIGSSRFHQGETVKVRIDRYKVERSATDCIVRASWFWVRKKEFCFLEPRQEMVVTGRIRAGLIDRLLGRIWLDQSSYYIADSGENRTEGSGERVGRMITDLRTKLVKSTLAFLPSPEGELVLGIVMGYKGSLPRAFYDQLVSSGTVHIVVASGYNVMVVAGLALAAAVVFWRRRTATVVAIGLVWLYVVLAGGEVSLIRAALMGSLVLTALAWGRRSQVRWSLALAAGTMVLISPTLIESVSFQLSVAATYGVAEIGPGLKRWWGRDDQMELTTTLGALLATAPIIWWHFGRVSLVALVSNSLVLPIVPLVMLLGGLTIVVSFLAPPLAAVLAVPTYALAHLVVVLIRIFGSS